MEQFNNLKFIRLAATCLIGDTSITVDTPSALLLTGNYRVIIDAEIMLATSRSGAVVQVTRGVEGTTASAHASGATVLPGVTAQALVNISRLQGQVNVVTGTPGTLTGILQVASCQSTGGPTTVNLPASAVAEMRAMVFDDNNNASTNHITVSGNGANLEDPNSPGTFAASITMQVSSQAVLWWYDGTRWKIISSNGAATTSAGPPARGLTMSLRASNGINLISGTSNVTRWYDSAPSRTGQSWQAHAAPNNATLGTLNGQPAVVYPYQLGQGSAYTNPVPSNVGGQLIDTIVSAQEFSFGAVLQYTGSEVISIGADLRTVYMILGEDTGVTTFDVGLAVGIASVGFIKFLAWINDSGVAGATTVIDGVNVKGMISAAVDATRAHTVILTFSATTGNYSLYVDNLAPVTIAGVGPIIRLQTPGGGANAFFSNNVQNGGMTLAEGDAACVCWTAGEITQEIAQLKLAGGL